MTSWREFQAMTPIELSVVPSVVTDVLIEDFADDGEEWAMLARNAMLTHNRGVEASLVTIPLHPDALVALNRWLCERRFSACSQKANVRRMARLQYRVDEALGCHVEHPWFNGRVVLGTEANVPAIPAWHDAGVLRPWWGDGFEPVVLHPASRKAPGSGATVCSFTIEEVTR